MEKEVDLDKLVNWLNRYEKEVDLDKLVNWLNRYEKEVDLDKLVNWLNRDGIGKLAIDIWPKASSEAGQVSWF